MNDIGSVEKAVKLLYLRICAALGYRESSSSYLSVKVYMSMDCVIDIVLLSGGF